MQLKIVQYFILLMLFLLSCCCDNYDFYKIANIEMNESLIDINFDDLKTFFQNILAEGNKNMKDMKDIKINGVFSLKYIEYQYISSKELEEFTQIKNYWNEEKIKKLKEQIQFSTIVSYPYYIEFLLRLRKLLIDNTKNGISFFTSIGGSGRSIHYPCGYNLRNIVNRNEKFLNVTNNDLLNKDKRQTQFPIFANKNIFVKNNNILTFFENRLQIQFDDNAQVKYKYICSVLEYFAQLGNPIFTIYGRGVQQSVAAYNIALMLKELFNFDTKDFFYNGEYSLLDIFERNGDKVGLKNNTEIIKQLEKVGASAEKDVIMLAGAITLNNLLYKIFRSVRAVEKDINCVLGFESYSGRVWEILIAIWGKNYDNFSVREKTVEINKNDLQCVLTHCLIGDNKLLPEYQIGNQKEVTINTPQILKNLVNGNDGLGEDRLYYLDCDKICGCNLNKIVDFWKNLTGRPTLQIISNIKNNNGNGFLGSIKHFFRYEWDYLITSYFNSPYNDGMLSDDGLFIYEDNNKGFSDFCKKIFKDYTSGENLEKNLNDKYELKILEDDSKTFYINDKKINIIYIVVGHGTHLENKRHNPYNGYFENITKILNKIENKIA
jgi:hypothetical protein